MTVYAPKALEIYPPFPLGARPAEATVLAGCLAIVARLATGLPICPIPEQAQVATVRRNVINHLGRRHHAGLGAFHFAKRMHPQERIPRLLPRAAVEPRRGRAAPRRDRSSASAWCRWSLHAPELTSVEQPGLVHSRRARVGIVTSNARRPEAVRPPGAVLRIVSVAQVRNDGR